MVKIEFIYRDYFTKGKWNSQSCIVGSLEECINLYGLGVDCEYKIISIKEC